MKANAKKASKQVAVLGLFTALIIILQILSAFMKIGIFPLSFVLVPIVLAANLYGIKESTILGAVFGVVVIVCNLTGFDALGAILTQERPVLTTVICFLKGALAGLAAGLMAKALKNANQYLRVLCTAIITPVVNTGLFLLGISLMQDTIVDSMAKLGAPTTFSAFVITIITINFAAELVINIIVSPALPNVIKAVKRINHF